MDASVKTAEVNEAGFRPVLRDWLDRLRQGDEIAHLATLTFAAAILALTLLLGFELYRSSHLTVVKFGWSFFTSSKWDPVAGEFGALPFIYGTIITSVLALVIAVPLGLGSALFLSEMRSEEHTSELQSQR